MTVDVCTTCLFKDDDLVTIDEELLQILNNLMQPNSFGLSNFLNVETRICYPCQERLQEMGHFRDTVLNAVTTLKTQLENDKLLKKPNIKILKINTSKFVLGNENEFVVFTSIPQTEFTGTSLDTVTVDPLSTKTGNTNDSLLKFTNVASVPEQVTKMNMFGADVVKETESKMSKTNIAQVKAKVNVNTPQNKAAEIIKSQFQTCEQPVVKLLPEILNKNFSAVKPTTESDHDYTERVGSPTAIYVKEIHEREIQEDANDEESDQQWYIKVLTNDEILVRMETKRRKPEFLAAPHKCSRCVICFKSASDSKLHRKQCHALSVGRFACYICSRRFPTLVRLNRHVPLHCRNVYVCARCGYDTYDRRLILAHACGSNKMKRKKVDADKVHQCQLCAKTFKSRVGATMHVELRHKNLPKEQCQICNRVFKNCYSLRSHTRHEHSGKPKDKHKYYCQECDHAFYNAAGLKTHLQSSLKHVSKDDFKYLCDQCDRKFYFERDLREHIKIVHLKERPFKCSDCNKWFATERARRRHAAAAHAQHRRTRACAVCGAAFAHQRTLEAHMRRHTGERPYHCEQCPATFSFSGALYKHKQLLHGDAKKPEQSAESSCIQGTDGVEWPHSGPSSTEESGIIKFYVSQKLRNK